MASRIYGSIDGQRTVAEILLHAHASEYLVTRFLSELLRSGLAEILETRDLAGEATPEPSPRAASPPPRPGPAGGRVAAAPVTAPAGVKTAPPAAAGLQPQLAAAGELVGRGEYDAALDILNTAYRTHPEDRALGRLLAEAEAAFVEKAYRRYLPPSTIPVLKRAPEGLESERLTPEEFFLLSRIDGTWDVKSIIQISPIREVDALRALKRMHEKGFIELREPK
jgi:hypothetical protein